MRYESKTLAERHWAIQDSHYNKAEVKFKLIEYTKNKEVALLVPKCFCKDIGYKSVRCLRMHSVQHLDFILSQLLKSKLYKTPYNLYSSLATYKEGIPKFTPDLFKRKDLPEYLHWKDKHYEHIHNYDWLIDIDAPNHNDMDIAHTSLKRVIHRLNDWNIPYNVRFSGCGFHCVVPAWYVGMMRMSYNPHEKDSLYSRLYKATKFLYDEESEMVDYNLNDDRRLCRLPYSISHYYDRSLMCLPLNSRKEIQNFTLLDAEPKKWYGYIRGREDFMFNSEDFRVPNLFIKRWA